MNARTWLPPLRREREMGKIRDLLVISMTQNEKYRRKIRWSEGNPFLFSWTELRPWENDVSM
jgi:hypothetical protein